MHVKFIEHYLASRPQERQSGNKPREKMNGVASALSLWLGLGNPEHVDKGIWSDSALLGLSHPEHVNKGNSSHSSGGMDKGSLSYPLRIEDEHPESMTRSLPMADTGVTVKGKTIHQHQNLEDHDEVLSSEDDEVEARNIYVNSNCQGINNSIMFDASCTSNDPGVQVDIKDVAEPH